MAVLAADARPASAPAPAAPATAAVDAGRAEQRAAGQTLVRAVVRDHWGAMTPCTWLTSLLSASIARESSWRCGSVTVS